jgi:two-component system catabolic regulation response regulator CreB
MTDPATILIIDDEPSVADTIVYALRSEGFLPVWCATGQEGLEALRTQPPALVVLDVGLPDANGFDLCRDIRKVSTVPILFLTARADEVDRIVGLELGADDYVTKPFSPRELAARVKAILRRTGAEQEHAAGEEILAGLPFSIDGDRHQIAFFDAVLPLSRIEFRLLEVLLHRPGRIFSRSSLMDLAWDEPDASMERTVDAHIKGIRAKLRAVRPGEDVIVTHRGIGYALKEDW